MTKKVGELVKLEDVYFYYAQIKDSRKNKDEPDKPPHFSVQVLVSEEQYDAFTEEFPKNGAKIYKGAAKFKEQFKVDPPYEAPKYFMLQLKRKDDIKGEPLGENLRPKTWIKNAAGKLVNQTDTLVGNGSAGVVSYSTFEVKQGKFAGIYPQLGSIMVTKLVPYVGRSANDGSEFGEVEPESEFEGSSKPAEAPKASAAPKATAKAKVVVEDNFDDDDTPF